MAKFFYSMQNILDIKLKLEETAKQEYSEARMRLSEEEEKLALIEERRDSYYREYQEALQGNLDFLKIEECKYSIDVMGDMIIKQNDIIKQRSKELELVRQKLNQVMQERKMHEKLKEKQFDTFKQELNAQENKETDEVAGYQFTHAMTKTGV